MATALESYEDYAQLVFSLLTKEISFTMPNIPHLLAQIEANYE